ncbi:hypothetical protein GCM10010508_46570 [Streptomyces naganishii JCM 4654]|uniref:Integrase catalytic domain-containing protein n=1 Tax=Streptomyces naganishii JCM 4654 TaxID=1306179 RepID=A0A918Y694_9ACTN|nr:hypothetical protein GCM10010508_46570 [Streptomyces naganishii JCM 4654]
MRINHIVGRHLRKKKRTTIADRTAPPVPDLVMPDFTADTLNSRCGDITYIAVGSTWLHLATVIDICSRKVVGCSIADHMRTSLVTDAIEMAVADRGGRVRGVVFHTDRGAQYSAAAFADVCRRHGIRRSMGIKLRRRPRRVVLPGHQPRRDSAHLRALPARCRARLPGRLSPTTESA